MDQEQSSLSAAVQSIFHQFDAFVRMGRGDHKRGAEFALDYGYGIGTVLFLCDGGRTHSRSFRHAQFTEAAGGVVEFVQGLRGLGSKNSHHELPIERFFTNSEEARFGKAKEDKCSDVASLRSGSVRLCVCSIAQLGASHPTGRVYHSNVEEPTLHFPPDLSPDENRSHCRQLRPAPRLLSVARYEPTRTGGYCAEPEIVFACVRWSLVERKGVDWLRMSCLLCEYPPPFFFLPLLCRAPSMKGIELTTF